MLTKLKGLDGSTYLLMTGLILTLLSRAYDILVLNVDITLAYTLFSSFITISLIFLIYCNSHKYKYVSEIFYSLGLVYIIYYTVYTDLSYTTVFTQFFLAIMLLRYERNNFILLHMSAILIAFILTYYCYHEGYYSIEKSLGLFFKLFCEWLFTLIVHKNVYKKHMDQLEELSPLVSIGRSTSFLLHEIKGPLHLLERDLSKTSNEKNSYIQEIKRLIEVSNSYANNKIEHDFSRFDISQLIEKTYDLYQSQIKYLEIDVEFNYYNKMVYTDKTCLSIILKNIIKNSLESAIDYNHKPFSRIQTEQVADYFKITLENTTSNKEHILSRIFTPGFTTKKGGANMGHGLYLSKKLIEDLGGTINIEIHNDIFKVTILLPNKEN